jgi:hypothetical protein
VSGTPTTSGTYNFTAKVTDSLGVSATATDTITVNPQTNVQVTYTGTVYYATSSSSSNSFTVTLSATIKDLSGGSGNIGTANVVFVNRDTGTLISPTPIAVTAGSDPTTGTVSYTWSSNIGTALSQSFTIGIVVGGNSISDMTYAGTPVGGNYQRNSSDDDAILTVARPQISSTGGGYLVNTSSSTGTYKGDPGEKTNFGYDAKNTSSGVQGQFNIVIHNGNDVYQVKSTSLSSMTAGPVSGTTWYQSTILGTGTFVKVTNPANPSTIDSNVTVQINSVDEGEPGKNDRIGIAVWNGAIGTGTLLYSNHGLDGSNNPNQDTLSGGNLQIQTAQEAAGQPTAGDLATASAPLTQDALKPIIAEAIARWRAAGIDARRLSALDRVTFQIDDLPAGDLGMSMPGVITLDRTASGFGWFIDPTPGNDSEFAPGAVNSPARGHMDLLSVVAHELGHQLGFGEDDGTAVMAMYLPAGVRHVPLPVATQPTPDTPAPIAVAAPSIQPVVTASVGVPAAPVVTSITTVPQATAPELIPAVQASHTRHHRGGQQTVRVHQAASQTARSASGTSPPPGRSVRPGRCARRAGPWPSGPMADRSWRWTFAATSAPGPCPGPRPGRSIG